MKVPRSRISKLALATLAACVGAGSIASASGDRALPVDQRVRGAEKVVVATTRTVDARWSQNKHGDRLIVSRVLLQVEETLKGSDVESVWMDVEGGTLDGVTLRVSDLPKLQPGERAVFFLSGAGAAAYSPYKRGQGILRLDERDVVRGSSLKLEDIRRAARGNSK